MERIITVTILLSLSFAVTYAHHNWDWMDCHHGVYEEVYSKSEFWCNCTDGWTGVDCSLCADSSVCGTGQTCNKSIPIGGNEKSYNCTPTGGSQFPGLGSVTAQFTFPNDSYTGGAGVLSVFVHPNGAPFMFNCTFDNCTETLNTNQMILTCQHSSCWCSEWCSAVVANIIKGMKGKATIDCTFQGNCTITQVNMPLVIEVFCEAAGCESTPPSYPPEFTKEEIIIMSVSTVGGTLLTVGVILVSCIVFKRHHHHKYQRLGHKSYQATLSWRDLTCTLDVNGKTRTVVNGITGVAVPGQVTAILGPSGAGKTSFLDVLAGRKNVGKIGGQILVNGRPVNKNFKRIAGYVMQDDKMLGTFTVKEHLMYVAEFRLPSGMPRSQKEERVNAVMEELGIAHIANSRIGTDMTRGISGGERRRLSIASELVTDPSILFLDEPTSGLDSYNAHSLMQTLSALAKKKNRTIITTIHQPRSNIYFMFDNVILLAQGELVYYGPAIHAIDYFKSLGHECPRNYNPADFIVDLVELQSKNIRQLSQQFKDSHIANQMDSNVDASTNTIYDDVLEGSDFEQYASSWFTQVYVLCKRTILNNLRNPYLLRTQYVMIITLSVLIGVIFFKLSLDLQGVQDRAGSLFFLIALLSFSAMSSIDIFYHERPIFVRERANGMYCTSAYFVAKTFCDVVPMRVFPPVIMSSITYFMIGLHPGTDHFLVNMSVLVLVSLVATCMCLTISSITPSLNIGNLIAIMLLLFFLLFGGFLVNKTSMPVFLGWLQWSSFQSYAFEILLVNELTGLTIMFNPSGYDIKPVPVAGETFLAQFDMQANRVGLDYGVLGGMIAFYLILTYVFLRFCNNEKR